MPNPNCEQCYGRGYYYETITVTDGDGKKIKASAGRQCQPCKEYDREKEGKK